MFSYVAKCQNGYYGYDRRVYVNRRLAKMPAAQAGVLIRDNIVQLVSYETIVAEIDNDWLHVYGLFSATTRKHIGAFLHEYAPQLSYYSAKACFEHDNEMNVKTGEVRPASSGMIQTVGVKA